jgi:hypothetical protein
MISLRAPTGPIACTFFKPIHLHAQLANLLVELGHKLLVVWAGCASGGFKELGKSIPDHSLPLGHLHRVHLILTGNLPNRF